MRTIRNYFLKEFIGKQYGGKKMFSKIKKGFSLTNTNNIFIIGSLALVSSLSLNFSSANAFDLGNGRTTFVKSPILIRTAASRLSTSSPSSYQFTIKIPEEAGESLKAVTISPKENAEKIDFNLSNSDAFVGDSFAGGSSLSLSSIGGSQIYGSNDVTFVFDEPVKPGSTVTLSLEAKKNPRFGGIYLFGVTAFPEGENSPGLYLGSARLHFSQN